MNEDLAQSELQALATQWTGRPDMRICAICLDEHPRLDHDAHMRSHGYEILHVVLKTPHG